MKRGGSKKINRKMMQQQTTTSIHMPQQTTTISRTTVLTNRPHIRINLLPTTSTLISTMALVWIIRTSCQIRCMETLKTKKVRLSMETTTKTMVPGKVHPQKEPLEAPPEAPDPTNKDPDRRVNPVPTVIPEAAGHHQRQGRILLNPARTRNIPTVLVPSIRTKTTQMISTTREVTMKTKGAVGLTRALGLGTCRATAAILLEAPIRNTTIPITTMARRNIMIQKFTKTTKIGMRRDTRRARTPPDHLLAPDCHL